MTVRCELLCLIFTNYFILLPFTIGDGDIHLSGVWSWDESKPDGCGHDHGDSDSENECGMHGDDDSEEGSEEGSEDEDDEGELRVAVNIFGETLLLCVL